MVTFLLLKYFHDNIFLYKNISMAINSLNFIYLFPSQHLNKNKYFHDNTQKSAFFTNLPNSSFNS